MLIIPPVQIERNPFACNLHDNAKELSVAVICEKRGCADCVTKPSPAPTSRRVFESSSIASFKMVRHCDVDRTCMRDMLRIPSAVYLSIDGREKAITKLIFTFIITTTYSYYLDVYRIREPLIQHHLHRLNHFSMSDYHHLPSVFMPWCCNALKRVEFESH